MTPSMQHHRTTRKKSFVHGLAPRHDHFDEPTWTPVDRAVRRAAWSRHRSNRDMRSRWIHTAGMIGAMLVLIIGIATSVGADRTNPLENAQIRQRAEFVQAEATRAKAEEAAAVISTVIPKG